MPRINIGPGQLDNDTEWLAVAEIKAMYIQDEGNDWFCLHITQPDGRQVIVPMPPGATRYACVALAGLLENVPELRSEWVATNGGKG